MRHEVPPKIGKVRVAITIGNRYVVWNGKQGRGEFRITCKDKRQATAAAQQINQMRGSAGIIDVD